MRLLANPVLLRAAMVFFCGLAAFFLGLYMIRRLRKNIAAEADVSDAASPSIDTLPLYLYNTVIQQLKQQKHELQVQSQAEQQRARTTENFSQTVLSNLSCGVLVFGSNGLVKTANPAAKSILGFASTTGMSAQDIFRASAVHSPAFSSPGVSPDETPDTTVRIVDEIDAVLREGSKRREIEADYESPSGEKRFLRMTISRVPAADGGLLGVACVINDLSEMERMRRQQELHGEISAEMALQLRSSLTTISGFAQQLANNRDPELAREIATDIAQEAVQLDRTIGGFLTSKDSSSLALRHSAK
ncbi:MAG TPA: PAS domain-containing protein [Candidatus Sulfotelmatobacter sp.]|nr:PAS domain-containing protein [Candidatus Sulfotelmatobacter sp.]